MSENSEKKEIFLVDTHCHLNKEYFPDDYEETLRRAYENGVKRVIIASSDIATSREDKELADHAPDFMQIYAAAGVHPHEAAKAQEGYLDEIKNICASGRVCAVGEIGLDYFYDISPRDAQLRVFREQVELAQKINKPIIIHVRDAKEKSSGDAWRDLLSVLNECSINSSPGVIHCFTGREEEARAAMEMGFYISFAGPLTHKRNNALRETASKIPLDRILCETDSPYLAPQSCRGSRNEPANVREVYEYMSMLKAIPLEELADIVRENGERLFNIGRQ